MLEKVKVILVDDDPDELYFMERGFEASGLFEVLGTVTSSHDLHALLERHPRPEVVVTDLNLDVKSGAQIARDLSNDPVYREIRVVVLSVTTEEDRGPALPGDALFFPNPSLYSTTRHLLQQYMSASTLTLSTVGLVRIENCSTTFICVCLNHIVREMFERNGPAFLF